MAKSAAAKPQSLSPSPPMPQSHPDQSPKAMTTAELEATIAALPAKKDALREAFDRLAACSPFPLPFAWDDLDAHISYIQSSISLRHRQLRVLEAACPALVPTGDDEKGTNQGDEETSEEEEEEDEAEEEEQETEEAEEGDEDVVEELVVEEEEEGEEEVEEVEVEVEEEEEVDANNVANKEQNSDEEAQEDEVKEHKELVATDEADDKEQKVHKVDKGEEEQDGEMEKEEAGEAKKVLLKVVCPALQDVNKHLVKACATMNTQSLVNLLFKNNIDRQEYPTAVRHAKDAAALILDVVRRFLPNKKTNNKVWENCVMLIRCVPLVEPKLSVHTTEQAKQLAKDWKKIIDKGESCGDLGNLASWAFLYFLISYNIVSEFDVGEIIRLFGTVPRKYQRKNCLNLCNGLGLVSRISDLIDYLIGNGQELSAIQMTQLFKLVDKYPPLSLLEGYVEKAKRTALELFSKNVSDKSLNPAKTKEIDNLWIAHTMIKQQHADSSKSSTILEEINNLLAEYTKSRTASRQQQKEEQKFQKRKKEQQQHEVQDRQVQVKQRKLKGNQEQPQESKDQQRHENKRNAQAKKQKQQQQQIEPQKRPQQHLNQPRPCVTKLATTVRPSPRFVPPAVTSVAQISPIGNQPFDLMPGASQPRFQGIQGGPLAANGVPQYNPFQQNPLYLHPSFYPR